MPQIVDETHTTSSPNAADNQSWLSRIPLFNRKNSIPSSPTTTTTTTTTASSVDNPLSTNTAIDRIAHGHTVTDDIYDAKDTALSKADQAKRSAIYKAEELKDTAATKAAQVKDAAAAKANEVKTNMANSLKPSTPPVPPTTADKTVSTPSSIMAGASEKVSEISNSIQNKASELSGDVRNKLQETKESVEKTTQDLKQKAEQGIETLRQKTIGSSSTPSTISTPTSTSTSTSESTTVTPISDALSNQPVSPNTAIDRALHGNTTTDKIYEYKDSILLRLKKVAPVGDPSTMTIDSPVAGAGTTVGRRSYAEDVNTDTLTTEVQRKLSQETAEIEKAVGERRKSSTLEKIDSDSLFGKQQEMKQPQESRAGWMWRRPSNTTSEEFSPFRHVMPEDLSLQSENLADIVKANSRDV